MAKQFWSALSCRAGVFLLSLSLVTLACGGSGGGGSAGGGGGTGTASVFLTDSPSDQFDEILVTITSLELLGNQAPVTIFSGRETVDLKDLENFSDLFVYAEAVPVGAYEKIRMGVSAIELVDDGAVTQVDPPASGRIDLIPRSAFDIREGGNLVIEIDIDAKKSIHFSNGYRFRPVIFVAIQETITPGKLARVHGEITRLRGDGDFELCSTVFMAARTNASHEGVEARGLGDRHRCMRIELDGDTGVFDSNGDPADASALMLGDEVTLVGRFRRMVNVDVNVDIDVNRDEHGDLRDDEDQHDHNSAANEHGDSARASDRNHAVELGSDELRRRRRPHYRPAIIFTAYVVEVGPPGTFLHLKGVIDSQLDEVDEFDFAIASGQGFGDASVVTALLQDGTRIFSRRGVEIVEGEIIPDTGARIDGVFATDAMGTFYKTALLVLDLQIDPVTVLRGEILRADEMTRRLLLGLDGGDECVDVPQEAGIFLIRNDASGWISEEGEFADLLPELRADIYGMFVEVGGCFVADTIIAFPNSCLSSAECSVEQFCSKEAGACEELGVCETAPEACIQIYLPVCGCDGVSYGNECEANASGTSVASEGVCED